MAVVVLWGGGGGGAEETCYKWLVGINQSLFRLPLCRSAGRHFNRIRYPSSRVSYYFPSARQVPPIPIRASATIPLPRVRYPPLRQAPPTPGPRVSPYAAAIRPAARQVPLDLPSSARQFPPYSHPRVSYYFPSAHQVIPILIRASATIPLPRVRYPPPPSARQLLSSLPRIRYPRVRCAQA